MGLVITYWFLTRLPVVVLAGIFWASKYNQNYNSDKLVFIRKGNGADFTLLTASLLPFVLEFILLILLIETYWSKINKTKRKTL